MGNQENQKGQHNNQYNSQYKDQFKPWVKHKQASLIMDCDADKDFFRKLRASEVANVFIAKMTGTKMKSFEDEWGDDYTNQYGL